MAITLQRILIDAAGSTRVFYSRDDGPAGTAVVELEGTAELAALTALIQKEVTETIAAASTPEGREAARAARLAQLAEKRAGGAR